MKKKKVFPKLFELESKENILKEKLDKENLGNNKSTLRSLISDLMIRFNPN